MLTSNITTGIKQKIESEAHKIETLKNALEIKKIEVLKLENRLAEDLHSTLDQSESNIKQLLVMDDAKFQEYVNEQDLKINQWKSNTYNALLRQKEDIHDKLTVHNSSLFFVSFFCLVCISLFFPDC